MSNLKRNFGYNFLYQIFIMFTPFVTAPYISRVLEADGVGIYSYTSSIVSYFLLFASLGTVSYGMREIARNKEDKKTLSKIFWEIELITVFTSIVCLCLWIGLIFISDSNRWYFLSLTPLILGVMFDISWLFNGLEEVKTMVTRNSLIKIIGILLLFVLVRDKNDLIIYIIIQSATVCIANAIMWLEVPKYIEKVKFRELIYKKHIKETFIYFIPTVATSIYTVLDKTLIGIITNDSYANGYYEQATKIVNMMKAAVFTSINIVVGSRNSYLFSVNKVEEARNITLRSLNFVLFLGIGSVFGICAVASTFVPLFFGKGYDPVIDMLCLLSPIVLIIGISNCLGSQYYNPIGKRAQSAKYLIAGSFVNLIINLFLIPAFGANGAIISSLIAELFITFLYLKNCNSFITLNNILLFSWKKIIAGIVMYILLNYIQLIIQSHSVIFLLLIILVGIVVYFLLTLMLKDDITVEFKRIFKLR